MTKIAKKLTDLIGQTPLLELGSYSQHYGLETPIVAKLEAFNPGGSVKDRIALAMIEEVVREVEIGKVYTGKVKTIEDFGCFVELWPGCEGLVHVSQLDVKRVEKPSDVVKVGDEIVVKATGFDKRGKLNLSRKELLPKPEKKEDKKEEKKHYEE